ncbi:MAG: TerC family protein, partial [Castellaniella sp.]
IKGGASVLAAVKTIIIADFVMSLDNVIAIAGAAQNAHVDHQIGLVIFGLLVSVPIIVWGSTLVLKLIDRFPVVVTLGAALLGWIAGGMLISDVFVVEHWGQAPAMWKIIAEIVGALLVVGGGMLWAKQKRKQMAARA